MTANLGENTYTFNEHDIEKFAVFVRKTGLSFSYPINFSSEAVLAREVITNFRLWLLAGGPIEPTDLGRTNEKTS